MPPLYQRFLDALADAGAVRLATDHLNRPAPCTLELWKLRGGMTLYVQYWPRSGGFRYFREGEARGVDAAIADLLS